MQQNNQQNPDGNKGNMQMFGFNANGQSGMQSGSNQTGNMNSSGVNGGTMGTVDNGNRTDMLTSTQSAKTQMSNILNNSGQSGNLGNMSQFAGQTSMSGQLGNQGNGGSNAQGLEIMPNGLPNYYSRKQGAPKDKDQPSIVAVRKTDAGIITDYKLSNGMELNKAQAIEYAKEHGINGVNVGRTRGEDHTEMLRANPTDDPQRALYNLPTF